MSKNYFIIFPNEQEVPEVGDIFQVSEVEIDYDYDCKAKLAICYIEKLEKYDEKTIKIKDESQGSNQTKKTKF